MKKITLLIAFMVFASGFGQRSVASLGESNPSFKQSRVIQDTPNSHNIVSEELISRATSNFSFNHWSTAIIYSNPQTRGATQTFTNRVDFNTACGSTLTLEDFGGGPGTIIACGAIISSAGDVCFAPGEIQVGIQVTRSAGDNTVYVPAGSFGNADPIVGANTFVEFTILNFPNNDVNSVGMDLYALTAGGTIQVRVFGTGGLIDTFNVTSPGTATFLGMIANETIVSIELQDLTGANAELVGRVEYGSCSGGGGGGVCTQSSASAAFQNGFFNQAPNISAVDVLVAADDDFTLEQITMNQFHNPGTTITSVNLTYYANAAGQPGAVIGTETVVPTSQAVVGANFGFDVSTVVLDVTPFLFAGQAGQSTTYWIGATVLSSNGGQTAWESNLTLQGNAMWSFFNGAWATTGEEGVYIISGQCAGGGGGGGGTCDSVVYSATGLPSDIDPGGTSTVDCVGAPNLYPVDVTGAGIIGDDAELENVTINITHTWSGDLEIYLISPSGTELALWDSVGGSGDNFSNTQFEDGGIPSAGSTAPHTGIYQPVGGTFAATFDGEDINGEWQLKICDTAGGDTGTLDSFTITFCTEDPGSTNNFECADAIVLTCGDVVAGSTTGATNSGGNASPDVFYEYTGSGEVELVTISLCGGGTSYDSYLRVFASCGNLSVGSEIAFNDDFCGLQSQLTFESDGTSTYIIMVEGFGTGSGDFSLAITCELAPVLECGGQFVDTGGPGGNYSNNEDEVWTITPDAEEVVTVTFTAFDVEANWDALYVYDGPDTSSPLISSGNPPTNTGFPAGGYWGTTNPGPFSSSHPTGALTFRFLSDGSVTRAGWLADITCLPVPPPNDLIVNAIDVDQFTQAYTDSDVRLQFATNELLNPDGCAIAGTNGVWYKFTATSDGTAEASVTTPSGTTAVIFYSAPNENVTDETDLVYTFESNNQCAPSTDASITTTAGQSYYIYVLNTGGESDVVIDISNSLGTGENVIDGFVFYPNPMENVLHITSNTSIDNVVIYNMLGQKVINQNIGATSSILNVSDLSTGAYIMKVTADGQTASYQLIKK